ncbi:MAG TPA: DMT family transporter [Gaiellaceae bacterium]|nr:DMT family transporter [Gaiellaceae bacterium]
MSAVLLALASAVCFGAMAVALRIGIRSHPEPDIAAVVTTVVGFLVAVTAAAFESGTGELARPRELAVFALAGLIAPGVSQIFLALAVRDAGASRTSVVVGSAPLFAATLAILLLDEPFEWPLAIGAVLIVGAGILLAAETVRPAHFRLAGMAFALAATILFSTRDIVVRWYSVDAVLGSVEAAAAAMAAGTLMLLAYAVAVRRGQVVHALTRPALLGFVPAGILFGLSYVLLFEAYYRGKVTVVSPLVATESLWGVLLAALVLRRSELVGSRLVLGAALVVAGGALIGAFR